MTSFWVPGVPASKGSWKVARGKLRPDNRREQPWAHAVGWSARAAGVVKLEGPVTVRVNFFFPKPKRPSNPYPSRNDVDKLARSILDALTHIAWGDDQQVVSLKVSKAWADERGPGAQLYIWEATP